MTSNNELQNGARELVRLEVGLVAGNSYYKGMTPDAFGLYLHFPFCPYKCSYCDFYKELYDTSLENRFFDALAIETELVASELVESGREITTIFVGGGTPSMISMERFIRWLEQLKRLFVVPVGIEFSLECNPDTVTVELFEGLKKLGVNRPTIGVQSFKPQLLKLLNRPHNPEDSQRAAYLAHAFGFRTFGVDLIFGLPKQTTGMLSEDLDEIIELDPPHISYYQLTVEHNTRLHEKIRSGALTIPDQDVMLAMYKAGFEKFTEAGYLRYEVSSFCKPGHVCEHNMGYWNGRDYLGLGPSAHSFMGGRRYANAPDLTTYVTSLRSGKRPLIEDDSGTHSRMIETVMMGLRTASGISRAQFARQFQTNLEEILDRRQFQLFVESGHVIPDGGTIRLSDEGLYLADEITRRLLR